MPRSEKIWFPIALNHNGIEWAETSAHELSSAAFLFPDVYKSSRKETRPVGDFSLQSGQGEQVQPRYIFHTAFCCSTLMARALDVPGKTLALKEPDILMQVSNLERNRPGQTGHISQAIAQGLFSGTGEARIVKPTNAANRIIPNVMNDPHARAIIIHSDLDSFVLSIARKGEAGRNFVRRLYNIVSMDTPFAQNLPQRDVFTLSDLQIAGFVWAMQCEQINSAISRSPEKYRLVHCDDFLAQPERTLSACSSFFDLNMSGDDVETQMASGLFGRDSKFPDQAYDTNLRKDERGEAVSVFADSLAFVSEWVSKLPLARQIQGAKKLI